MITLNQMIYQIYEGLQITSDDTSLDKRLIKDLINQSSAGHSHFSFQAYLI